MAALNSARGASSRPATAFRAGLQRRSGASSRPSVTLGKVVARLAVFTAAGLWGGCGLLPAQEARLRSETVRPALERAGGVRLAPLAEARTGLEATLTGGGAEQGLTALVFYAEADAMALLASGSASLDSGRVLRSRNVVVLYRHGRGAPDRAAAIRSALQRLRPA